ncbi:MAG: hypothetical protein JNJ49_08775 [Bdellovibrionaceae bacterium]|nr:hypothetical protein [Pseudobdellovibrionaceae bacterium]
MRFHNFLQFMVGTRARRLADSVLSRLGYVRFKVPVPRGSPIFRFTDRDVVVAAVLKVLRNNMDSNSPADIEMIADVANQVAAELEKAPDISIADQIKRYDSGILAHRQLTYVLACGIASYWELSVKNLAEKLKVPVFELNTSERRQSPGLRPFEPIINDLKKAAPKLDVWLTKRKNLRDALTHGNFHQLKTHLISGRSRSDAEKLHGKVWMARLSDQTIEKMSEIRDLAEIKRVGLFGWFLEVAASEVLEQTIIELKRATDDIQLLIMFHATCFHERRGLFEKMFVKGERLAPEEIELFKSEPGYEEVSKVFERLNSMIKAGA